MSSSLSTCFLYLQTNAWQLVSLHGELAEASTAHPVSSGDWGAEAAAIVESLEAAGQIKHPIVIGLAAEWCLSATLPLASPQLLRKPQVLHYQLEEQIPWSAEEYASDFVGHRSEAFCVAVRHQTLAPLLKRLDEEGVQIAAMAPLPMLGLAEHLADKNWPADHCVLWQTSDAIDVITIRNRRPTHWNRLPTAAAEALRQVRWLQLKWNGELPLYARSMDPEIAEQLAKLGVQVSEGEPAMLESACRVSHAICAGQQEPLLNLRKGLLASANGTRVLGKEWRRLKLAAAVLLLCLSVAFWIQGRNYRLVADHVRDDLVEVFCELFPERAQNVPDRIGVAIDKQHRILRGTRAPDKDLPSPVAADVVLQQLLSGLPPKQRFRVPEIQIEQNRVSMAAEVRSNADADQLAAALRENGFSVSAPRTRRLVDKGFGVRLSAESVAKKITKKGAQ